MFIYCDSKLQTVHVIHNVIIYVRKYCGICVIKHYIHLLLLFHSLLCFCVGKTIINHSPVFTIFIGGIILPFPVMAGV